MCLALSPTQKACCPPAGRWDCPWHHCDVCGKNSEAFCQLCPNSFCKSHQEGALRPFPVTGQLCCQEHEELDVPTSHGQEDGSKTNTTGPVGADGRPPKGSKAKTKSSKRKAEWSWIPRRAGRTSQTLSWLKNQTNPYLTSAWSQRPNHCTSSSGKRWCLASSAPDITEVFSGLFAPLRCKHRSGGSNPSLLQPGFKCYFHPLLFLRTKETSRFVQKYWNKTERGLVKL